MRYAIVSDLHANADAFEAVLRDAHSMDVTKIITLGDVVGYGPEPKKTVDLVRLYAKSLMGNHDAAVAGIIDTDNFNDYAASVAKKHRKLLGDDDLQWLAKRQYVLEFPGFACVHGDFTNPVAFDYVCDDKSALANFKANGHALMFVGHTHEACIYVLGESGVPHRLPPEDFVLEEGKRYIVNPGTAGYPREGKLAGTYVIYDDESKSVFYRSVAFNINTYSERMREAGFVEALEGAREVYRETVRRNKVKLASVIAGSVVLIVGLALCLTLERGKNETFPAVAGEAAPADVAQYETMPLASGWQAKVPVGKNARVQTTVKNGNAFFKLTAEEDADIVLEKAIRLQLAPRNVFFELLIDQKRGGKAMTVTKVAFLDEGGKVIGSNVFTSKLSAKRKIRRPDGSDAARVEIDCSFDGEIEIAMPYFADHSR